MRAIAEFIMRGRLQACMVALAGNLVPLLSPATVGLVALRRGIPDGVLVLVWACLPLLITLAMSDINLLIMGSSFVGLAAVLVGAEVLKSSASWQATLVVGLAAIAAALAILGAFLGVTSGVLVDEVQAVLVQLQSQGMEAPASVFYLLMGATALGLGLDQVGLTFVLGFLSWLTALNVVGSLLVARWWQAMLYNPGGFQREFHALRFDRVVTLALLGGILACNTAGGDYQVWSNLLGLPLLIAGLGVLHWVVKARALKSYWLVAVYFGLVMFGPLSLVLIGIGFLDSFMNLRPRLAPSAG